MSSDFYSFIENPFFQLAFSFMIESLLQKTQSKKKNSDELIAQQLYSCIKSAYIATCNHFGWEYDNNALEALLQRYNAPISYESLSDDLIDILKSASGSDETGIVNEEVIHYLFQRLLENISCAQELYNFLILRKNHYPTATPSNIMPNTDNKEYEEAFSTPLFLESTICDENAARLQDVYIPAKYKVALPEGDNRIDLSVMLNSFFNRRDQFKWQQDDRFPSISNKIFAIMIMGKPGSGKSSFISYLSTQLPIMAKSRPYYIIRLRNMLKEQINANDPIQGLLDYMITDRSSLNNSIVILDGLDEICALYQNTDFHIYLKKLLQNLSMIQGLQLVLTSRTGYFKVDKAISNFCLTLHIEDWDNDDLDLWSMKYEIIHPNLRGTIESNRLHLEEAKYSDKKAIFAVPILFYMANARAELLSKHKNICSVYDAVLSEVSSTRQYDAAPYISIHEIIPQELSRQICTEIAFSMFRSGRLSYIDNSDPYLGSDEVNEAILAAINKCHSSIPVLNDIDKQRIRDTYALTFYYCKNNSEQNAVEFAHKTIAEYFTSKKILEIMFSLPEKATEDQLCSVLAECFGYAPITADILLFLYEEIKMEEGSPKILAIKNALERNFLCCVLNGNLFSPPKKYQTTVHYLDRASIMLRSTLMLYEYLNCVPPRAK